MPRPQPYAERSKSNEIGFTGIKRPANPYDKTKRFSKSAKDAD